MSFTPINLPNGGPKFIIVGAGIGGLTTALHLHAHGFTNLSLYEAAPALTTLGVGINVQPHAVLILRNLGLLNGLTKVAIETEELMYYNRHGDTIIQELRGKRAGYEVPQFSAHRGELQFLLLTAVKERLGPESIHLGRKFVGWTEEADGITAKFIETGTTGNKAEIRVKGDAIIAADGINSTARATLYPHEGQPRFSGRMLWRGCTMRPQQFLTGASMVWGGHADQKFVAYPISGVAKRSGSGSLVNWICELRVRSREECERNSNPPEKTDWTASVDKQKFIGPFKGWEMGGLNVTELVEETDKVFEFPMCDRDPVDRWSFGRLTLLGDSAHPMYPIGSNGASQAILDAEALTGALIKHISLQTSKVDISAAFIAYQNERLPPTAKIVMANRANGPDHVMQVAEERAPQGFKDVHDVIPKDELEDIGRTYKAIAGFERDSVNQKAKETEGIAERLALKAPKGWSVEEEALL